MKSADGSLLPSGSFVIRPYQPGDEQAINDMFNEVFQQKRELSHWYWKYRDNPNGSYCISLAVSPAGELAAHYGGYPMRLWFLPADGSAAIELPTYQFGDKMTRRRFRGVGFGRSSLLARTFEHMRATRGRGVPFGYGFGTHHSLRFGMRFLDYADIERVPFRKVALDALHAPKAARLRGFLSPIRVAEATEIDESWTRFFAAVAPSYRYLTKRDAGYLNWRYLARPDRRYLILSARKREALTGWAVFHREGERILWGDALFSPDEPDSAAAVLAHVRSHPFAAGARSIECWFPPRPDWWDEILRGLGFRNEPEPSDLHFTGPVFEDARAPETLRRSFYYTMGDGDLF